MSTPTFGTKLAQNPNYGRPSAKKLRWRTKCWRELPGVLAVKQKMFDDIHVEIEPTSRLFDSQNEGINPVLRLCKLIALINIEPTS